MRVLVILLLLASATVNAQTASDFTIDDIDGNSRNLFSELDNNNVVVLKFFTNWCPICNNTADEVNAIYNDYQTNGDPVVFWALDRDQNETNADATTYRNNNNIPFPVIGEAYSVAQQFGVVYQPEYYIIRPDRSYVKRTNHNGMKSSTDTALSSLETGVSESEQGRAGLRFVDNTITWVTSENERGTLTLTDVTGRNGFSRTINGQETVYLPEFSSGLYVYSISVENRVISKGKIGLVD